MTAIGYDLVMSPFGRKRRIEIGLTANGPAGLTMSEPFSSSRLFQRSGSGQDERRRQVRTLETPE